MTSSSRRDAVRDSSLQDQRVSPAEPRRTSSRRDPRSARRSPPHRPSSSTRQRRPRTGAATRSAFATRPARRPRRCCPPTHGRRGRPIPSPGPAHPGRTGRAPARRHSVRRAPLRRHATTPGEPRSTPPRKPRLVRPCTRRRRGARDPRRPAAPRDAPPSTGRTRHPTSDARTRHGLAPLDRPPPSAHDKPAWATSRPAQIARCSVSADAVAAATHLAFTVSRATPLSTGARQCATPLESGRRDTPPRSTGGCRRSLSTGSWQRAPR